MKIATFNVNSIKMRLAIVLDWLGTHKPDVLMLQELKTLEMPTAEIEAAGYDVFVVPQKTYNGVATLVRRGLQAEVIGRSLLPDDDQARYLEVRVNGVHMINIYAPNGNPVDSEKYPYKHRWLDALCARAAALRDARADFAILGDFNIIPEEVDAAHPKDWMGDALFMPESRAVFRRLKYLGLTDALRALHPDDAHLYTFWDYQAGAWPRNNGIRIDHALLSPRLADGLVGSGVDRGPRGGEKPSDHTPVWVDFTL